MDILDSNMFIYIAIWLFCLAPIMAALAAISYTTPVLMAVFAVVFVVYVVVQVGTTLDHCHISATGLHNTFKIHLSENLSFYKIRRIEPTFPACTRP